MSVQYLACSAEKIVPIKDTSFTGFYRHMTASERRPFGPARLDGRSTAWTS